MNDFLRKGFLLGLGAAVTGKEKLDSKLKELVDKNELTTEEAKSVMRNFVEKGESVQDEWGVKQTEKTQDLADEMGIATKEDLEELYTRISVLEERLADK